MKKILILFVFLLVFIPFKVSADDLILNDASSGILIEANSGKIIYEKDKDKRVAIASMTKMVAQIIILENIESGKLKWNDVITCTKTAEEMGGSQIYLKQGEKLTVEELMKGISMASGNDATVQMAEVIAGSEDKFVKLMNKKVKKLGLKNTHFTNCTGLDEENHYSSAYDMAMIARELVVNHKEILRFSSMYEDYLREGTDNKFWLVNTNKLVRYYEGADGLKTGHTDNAGYCLAATAKRNNIRLIGITLGFKNSKKRNEMTMKLLDYGFNNIKVNTLKKKDMIIKKIILDKADKNIINIYLKDNLNVYEDNISTNNKYKYKVNLNKIKLPIKSNDVVGNIEVYLNNKIISKELLYVKDNINKLKFIDLFVNSLVDIIIGNL